MTEVIDMKDGAALLSLESGAFLHAINERGYWVVSLIENEKSSEFLHRSADNYNTYEMVKNDLLFERNWRNI